MSCRQSSSLTQLLGNMKYLKSNGLGQQFLLCSYIYGRINRHSTCKGKQVFNSLSCQTFVSSYTVSVLFSYTWGTVDSHHVALPKVKWFCQGDHEWRWSWYSGWFDCVVASMLQVIKHNKYRINDKEEY